MEHISDDRGDMPRRRLGALCCHSVDIDEDHLVTGSLQGNRSLTDTDTSNQDLGYIFGVVEKLPRFFTFQGAMHGGNSEHFENKRQQKIFHISHRHRDIVKNQEFEFLLQIEASPETSQLDNYGDNAAKYMATATPSR